MTSCRESVLPGTAHAHAVVLFIDRQGSLWIGTSEAGVYRLYAGRLDHFASENGLSSNYVNNFSRIGKAISGWPLQKVWTVSAITA